MMLCQLDGHLEGIMDPLSDVLSVLQVEDAAFGRIEAGGQWALQSSKAKHVVFCTLIDGLCWLIPDNSDQPIQMAPGDCFAIANGASFRLCSDRRSRRRTTAPLEIVASSNIRLTAVIC